MKYQIIVDMIRKAFNVQIVTKQTIGQNLEQKIKLKA